MFRSSRVDDLQHWLHLGKNVSVTRGLKPSRIIALVSFRCFHTFSGLCPYLHGALLSPCPACSGFKSLHWALYL